MNDQGFVETWTNVTDYSTLSELKEIMNLPIPTGLNSKEDINLEESSKYDITSELKNFVNSYNNLENFSNFDVETIKAFNRLLTKINNNDGYYIYFLDKEGWELQDSDFENAINLIDKHNTYKGYLNNDMAVKNSIVSKINRIISSPINQVLANTPVSVEELHDVIKRNTERKQNIMNNYIINSHSDSVVYKPISNDVDSAFVDNDYVHTLWVDKKDGDVFAQNFSNPFTTNPSEVENNNNKDRTLILVPDVYGYNDAGVPIKGDIGNYIEWILNNPYNIEHNRRQWILQQLINGDLKGKKFIDSTNNPTVKSVANALNYLVNYYDWSNYSVDNEVYTRNAPITKHNGVPVIENDNLDTIVSYDSNSETLNINRSLLLEEWQRHIRPINIIDKSLLLNSQSKGKLGVNVAVQYSTNGGVVKINNSKGELTNQLPITKNGKNIYVNAISELFSNPFFNTEKFNTLDDVAKLDYLKKTSIDYGNWLTYDKYNTREHNRWLSREVKEKVGFYENDKPSRDIILRKQLIRALIMSGNLKGAYIHIPSGWGGKLSQNKEYLNHAYVLDFLINHHDSPFSKYINSPVSYNYNLGITNDINIEYIQNNTIPFTSINGNNHNIVVSGGRYFTVININGVNVPFYTSTGLGGKSSVETGKWYPFFGISDKGWINKTTESEINDYYGSEILKSVAENLNNLYPSSDYGVEVWNGMASATGDKGSQVPEATFFTNFKEVINKDMNPVENDKAYDTVTREKERILNLIGDSNLKPGVSELFESNPELANFIYEVAGIRNPNITILPNGNLKIIAFRTEKTGDTSKGQYQRGKGLYLSLDKPYPGEDIYTVEIEISPKNLLDRKLGFGEISEKYFIDEKNKRVDKQLDTLHEFKQSLGIKAEIGSIDGALMNELVLFDKELIDKALVSKQVYNPQQKQQAQQFYSQYLDNIFTGGGDSGIYINEYSRESYDAIRKYKSIGELERALLEKALLDNKDSLPDWILKEMRNSDKAQASTMSLNSVNSQSIDNINYKLSKNKDYLILENPNDKHYVSADKVNNYTEEQINWIKEQFGITSGDYLRVSNFLQDFKKSANEYFNQATNIGTNIDDLLREYTKLYVDGNTESFKNLKSLNPTIAKLPDNDFDNFLKNYHTFLDSLYEKGEKIVPADEIRLFSEAVNGDTKTKIAGTVDLMTYNSDSKTYHIYDYKTFRTNEFDNNAERYNRSYNNEMSKHDSHKLQLASYAIMLSNSYGIPLENIKIGVIPIKVYYETTTRVDSLLKNGEPNNYYVDDSSKKRHYFITEDTRKDQQNVTENLIQFITPEGNYVYDFGQVPSSVKSLSGYGTLRNKTSVDNTKVKKPEGTHTLHSGYAEGADRTFLFVGNQFNAFKTVNNYTYRKGAFYNGKYKLDPHNDYYSNGLMVDLMDNAILKANESLGRNIDNLIKLMNNESLSDLNPKEVDRYNWMLNTIRRNYYQVLNSDAMYAVSNFNMDNTVDGGTGWAVQMAIDMINSGDKSPNYEINVFDQNQNAWFRYNTESNGFEMLEETPVLKNNFAGIGTRHLTLSGLKAINNLFTTTFGEISYKADAKKASIDSLNRVLVKAGEIVSETSLFGQESNYYEGDIKPEPNTVFVFGSNPEGRHGLGAAKIAKEQFGAVYGQGEGLQGNAYALPTKDLRVKENRGLKSISPKQIIDSIIKLYDVAEQNPNKQFKIAYRNTIEPSLNGYTGLEMIEMFNDAAQIGIGYIPSNVIFSKEWVDTDKLNTQSKITPQQKQQTQEKGVIDKSTLLGPNDMFSYYEQQHNASVGRDNVGIAANGVKVTYALADYNNDFYNTLLKNKENGLSINEELVKTKLFNFIFDWTSDDGKTTHHRINSVADVQIPMDIRNELFEILEGSLDYKHSNAAKYLSDFLSAATDNAKELIMSKINASPTLASMPIFLYIMGFDAETMVEIMTSDPMVSLVQSLESNLFSENKQDSIYKIFKNLKIKYSTDAINSGNVDSIIKIYHASKEISSLASLLGVNQSRKANTFELYKYFNRFSSYLSTTSKSYSGYSSNLNVITFADSILKENPSNWKNIDEAVKIIIEANNNDIINNFDFEKYFEDTKYHKITNDYINLIKRTVNPFDVVESVPHYKGMVDGLYTTHKILKRLSAKYKFIFDDFRKVTENKSPNEFDINRAQLYFDNNVISNWAKTSEKARSIQFSVKDLMRLSGVKEFTYYVSPKAQNSSVIKGLDGTLNTKVAKIIKSSDIGDKIISLRDDVEIANFKLAVENLILPILQKHLGENNFFRLNTINDKFNMKMTALGSEVPLRNSNIPVLIEKFSKVLNTFDTIDLRFKYNTSIKNTESEYLKWKDLLFTYNLLVNNEKYGDNRLTALFQNYMGDKDGFGYDYIKFYREIDSGRIDVTSSDTFEDDLNFFVGNKNGEFNGIKANNSDFVILTNLVRDSSSDFSSLAEVNKIMDLINNNSLIVKLEC